MKRYDDRGFSAGRDAGIRLAACVAQEAAVQLCEGARWWNRWRRRLMARALLTYAAEIAAAGTSTAAQPA